MIFVTVGAQFPFPRLIAAMDAWAAAHPDVPVFAQIGTTEPEPRHLEWTRFLDAAPFRERVEASRVIVAHAGMGTILTALELAIPIVVMPRRADLGEHRNDHQLATVDRFGAMGRIRVAREVHDLERELARLDDAAAGPAISPHASPALLAALRAFVRDTDRG